MAKKLAMARKTRQLVSSFAAALLLLQPTGVIAEDVWLNPGYINGFVAAEGVDIEYAYLKAVSGEFTATSYSPTGEFTLTVNTPIDGGYDYDTGGYFYADNRNDYLHFPHETVFVQDGQTTSLNFELTPGFIQGTVNTGEGCSLTDGRIYAGDETATTNFVRDSINWIGSRTNIASDGTFLFPVVPGLNTTVAANITLSNGNNFNLETRTADILPGETITMDWSVECAGLPGAIYGLIGVNGVEDITKHQVRARRSDSSRYLYADIICSETECSYELNNLAPGKYYMYPITEMNNSDDELYYPRGAYDFTVDVVAGQAVRNDILTDAAFINGNITLSGTKTIKDAVWAEVGSFGKYGSYSYAGWGYDFVNILNGDFDLIVTEGDWQDSVSRFYFFQNDPEDYLRNYLYIYNYTTPHQSLLAGETIENHQIEHQTGSVTVRYTVDNNGLLSYPSLTGRSVQGDGSNVYVYAYGLPDQTTEGKVSFIAVPGTYDLKAEAYVGGSRTTFGELNIEVVYGGERDMDIGSPDLEVVSPQPEEYTDSTSILVAGTTTDEDGVASITVNGSETDFSSTNNPNDVNEVAYSTEVGLDPGPNTIEITVTDNLNKSITDTRSVYVDSEYPTILWEPADTTTTIEEVVTVIGTATDDNTITSITVNGDEVAFESTFNPDDPNEVEFTTEVALVEGSNQIIVAATDNCKLITSETHTVTRSEPDTTAPTITCPADISKEFGSTISLGSPIVSDNTDPSPSVSNNAPASFALGTTNVVWTASDSWGNKASCTQTVTLVDTTKPVISCPADATFEFGNSITLGEAEATDNVDTSPTISNNAPASFLLGTTVVLWTATDDSGNSATCSQNINVVDTTAPDLTCPADVTITLGDDLDLGMAQASDAADSDLDITNDRVEIFPIGTTSVTWEATDDSGNSASCEQLVMVEKPKDAIARFSVEPDTAILWPPNHKYVTLDLNITALTELGLDLSDKAMLQSVTSDEVEDDKKDGKKGKGDGNTIEDIVIVDNDTVKLRAERAGGGDGRVYTFNYTLTGPDGTELTASASVAVPLSPKKQAIDSGVHYTVKP